MEQSKDVQGEAQDKKELVITSPLGFFQKDKNFVFSYKKTEKLLAALYVVTNLLSNDEPLKWNVRELGASLLNTVVSIKDKIYSNAGESMISLRIISLELVSLLDVASLSGMISPMNVNILKKEFSILLETISLRERASSSNNDFVFPDDFFEIPVSTKEVEKNLPQSVGMEGYATNVVQKVVDDKGQNNIIKDKKYNQIQNTFSKGQNKLITPPLIRSSENKKNISGVVLKKKNHRQDTILAIIRKKKEVTIKDISGNVKDYSEKTIQRELIDLVAKGVLKKEGERRWSKYSII